MIVVEIVHAGFWSTRFGSAPSALRMLIDQKEVSNEKSSRDKKNAVTVPESFSAEISEKIGSKVWCFIYVSPLRYASPCLTLSMR